MFSRFTLGDTFELTTALAAYPASAGWVLKFRFIAREGSGTPIAITCTADGDSHEALVAAATTAGWTAGNYGWSSWVEQGAVSHSVESGSLVLLPNPRTATAPLDMRTQAEIALAQARAALASWSPKTKSYTIGGRSMEFNSADEIIAVVSYWENQVLAEQNAAGMNLGRGNKRKVFVRMGRG